MAGQNAEQAGSVERVRAILAAAGLGDAIVEFPAGTRTAIDAAAAVGCTVAQIAKSIVFRAPDPAGDRPVLVIASGINRVDPAKVAAVLGRPIKLADADWVRATTGFAIGGVAPVGHRVAPLLLFDRDLLALALVWAAAGSPRHVFALSPAALIRLTEAVVADVRTER